jgi:ABC-2 type transport system permease protein
MWALPGDAAVGDYGAACVKFAIALAWAGALWIGWNVLVRIMLDIPDRESRTKHYDGLGWFDTFKLGPVGAISARSITYWLRDPRYLMSLIVLPILMFLTIPLSLAGIPMQTLALLPVPAMCLFLGFTLHNDVSYDHTAVWLDLVSGTDGLADRIGRMIPVMLLGVPLVLIGSCVSVFLYGHWEVLPSMIGVSSALLLAAVGLSSYTSARFPYPAPKPGDSPFTQPQASDRASWIVQGFILVGALLVAAPSLAFAWLGLAYEPSFHAASLWVGVSAGIVVLLGGIGAGSYAYDQRSPEIMAAALRA